MYWILKNIEQDDIEFAKSMKNDNGYNVMGGTQTQEEFMEKMKERNKKRKMKNGR